MVEIPVIDIFAGPGGLGEGFSALINSDGYPCFKLCLSIEKDKYAYQTLTLRNFFKQFNSKQIPNSYYQYLKGKISFKELLGAFNDQRKTAVDATWHATLGNVPAKIVDHKIQTTLGDTDFWVLVGGPPCQAYSIVGRSRIGGIDPNDPRVYLYREYLRIIAEHNPPIFVMENVKGLLSSRIEGDLIFKEILKDLQNPSIGVRKLKGNGNNIFKDISYKLFSFSNRPKGFNSDGNPIYQPKDFIIECERYGIPQVRHRVFLLGIREDLNVDSFKLLRKRNKKIPVYKILESLPRIRSGLWREPDSKKLWIDRLNEALNKKWADELKNGLDIELYRKIADVIANIKPPHKNQGKEFVSGNKKIEYMRSWFHDGELGGACNHKAKSHKIDDIYRYLYASCYGKLYKKSPLLSDFPVSLLPAHKNIEDTENRRKLFADRFRVQLSGKPSTTITSHIAKDGHYYIHPDPSQCRSLTVREAARLQTFPDNYFFCGSRTSQYTQVGNAVPPLLSYQIAKVVFSMLESQHV